MGLRLHPFLRFFLHLTKSPTLKGQPSYCTFTKVFYAWSNKHKVATKLSRFDFIAEVNLVHVTKLFLLCQHCQRLHQTKTMNGYTKYCFHFSLLAIKINYNPLTLG